MWITLERRLLEVRRFNELLPLVYAILRPQKTVVLWEGVSEKRRGGCRGVLHGCVVWGGREVRLAANISYTVEVENYEEEHIG